MRYAVIGSCNAENLALYVCSDTGCDMKSFYQPLLCIGFLLEGKFVRAKVVSTVSYTYVQVFSVDNRV